MKLPLVGYLHSHRKLSSLPKDLLLELVQDADPITTLDIQAWLHETNAPVARVARLSDREGNFDQLAGEIREGGGVSRSSRQHPALFHLTLSQYAVVRSKENCGKTIYRLLFAPIGDFLLCAAFPDESDGSPNLPTHQPPREIRKLKRKEKSNVQPEQPQGASIAQDAEVSMQGDFNPSGSLDQEDAPAQHQEMSVDNMDVDEEQELGEEQDGGETDAGYESDLSDN